jgi:hypothetical protein
MLGGRHEALSNPEYHVPRGEERHEALSNPEYHVPRGEEKHEALSNLEIPCPLGAKPATNKLILHNSLSVRLEMVLSLGNFNIETILNDSNYKSRSLRFLFKHRTA